VDDDAPFLALARTIARGDRAGASQLLLAQPDLATTRVAVGATRQGAPGYFLDDILHHVYRDDTALHIAAAAYEVGFVRELMAAGADVAAANRRGAVPLHYAVDGGPGAPTWNPDRQRDTVACLIEFGADPNVRDKNGTPPLHRAVRNRGAAAVAALLAAGADPTATNKSGSTAMQLANWTTGRGGSGSAAAKEQQDEIIRLLRAVE